MRTRALSFLSLVLTLAALAPPGAAVSSRPELRARRELAKTGGRISADGLTSTVVVKFREGTVADLEGGRVVLKSSDEGRAAAAIAAAAVPDGVRPGFDRPAEELRAEEARLEATSGVDLADLSLYFDVRTASPEAAERLARELEAFDEIEVAYVRPAPLPMPKPDAGPVAVTEGATTPDFTAMQYYLGKAPGGFGAVDVRDEPGGRGQGVRIVDIEYSWNLNHEDLPFAGSNPPVVYEPGQDPFDDDNHGTAVLGMLVGVDNDFGVTGLCPDAVIGLISPVRSGTNYDLANAIDRAADVLARDGAKGDVIQIEQQARGISNEIAALPAEWDDKVFDAIQRAVARGLVVVEAAGNGGIRHGKGKGASLDNPVLGGKFDRKRRDSGAIMVGGGDPATADQSPTSNYGTRVDVQGYGRYVTTLGYGDLWNSLFAKYTGKFSGTSSATPCVTAVAVLVQAALRAHDLPELDAALMRAVLAGTGSPDGKISRPVGPRPNAKAAVEGVVDPSVPLITGLAYSKKRDELTIDGLYFRGVEVPSEEQTVVFVNDVEIPTSYVTGFPGPNGTTTRVVVIGAATYLPAGEISFIKVGNATGVRSTARVFVRKK